MPEVATNLLVAYANDKGKFGDLIGDKCVKVIVDPRALMHVIGTKMDYVEDLLK